VCVWQEQAGETPLANKMGGANVPAGEALQPSGNGTPEDEMLKSLERFKQLHSDGLLSTEVYHELQVELGKSMIPPADKHKGRGSAPYDRAGARTGSSSRTWKSGWGILGVLRAQCQSPCRFLPHSFTCILRSCAANTFVCMCTSSLR